MRAWIFARLGAVSSTVQTNLAILLLLATVHCCFAAKGVITAGRLARITVRVSDESGQPLANTIASVGTFSHHVPGDGFGEDKSANYSHLTDDKGLAVFEFVCLTGEVSYRVRNEGYYYDRGGEFAFQTLQNGQWQPWNPTVEVVLKPVLNPIPMYAKRVGLMHLPAEDTPLGYDLMAGDWVPPHGKGTNTDLIFFYQSQVTDPRWGYDLSLSLTFPNAADGIQSVLLPLRKGSVLRMRTAPESGYTNKLFQRVHRLSKETPNNSSVNDDLNYYFRVRTVQTNGQIVSALYGKIYGDIELTVNGDLNFTYYLNPAPNSRNLEFNTKSNLIKRLKSFAQPNDP